MRRAWRPGSCRRRAGPNGISADFVTPWRVRSPAEGDVLRCPRRAPRGDRHRLGHVERRCRVLVGLEPLVAAGGCRARLVRGMVVVSAVSVPPGQGLAAPASFERDRAARPARFARPRRTLGREVRELLAHAIPGDALGAAAIPGDAASINVVVDESPVSQLGAGRVRWRRCRRSRRSVLRARAGPAPRRCRRAAPGCGRCSRRREAAITTSNERE